MSKGSGVTRGDRRRNERRARLRMLVPAGNAVAGLDLGERKQALVVTGADGLVLARRSPLVSVHGLGGHLDWALARARAAGFSGLTVACEPTGSRWMVVAELCAQRGLAMVCVQPLVTHVARQQQDLTGDKTDEGDCVLIARLARELHCYVPEKVEGLWAELREAGRRRAQLITAATAAKQLIRDKLGLAAPALLAAGAEPLESATWLAGLEVVADQCGGDLAAAAGMGFAAFTAAVRGRLGGWGGQRAGATARKLFTALADTTAVAVPSRHAALRRIRHALEDLKYVRARRAAVEAEMTGLLGELGIDHARICQIPGLTPVGLAAVLAETGDLRQYASSSSVVKHAGMSPARNESAAFHGATKISRRGRPALRLAVWRATWGVLRHCDVLAAKHATLTSRGSGPLADAQARVACAASLLRWIYSLAVHGTRWNPAIAAGDLGHHHAVAA
jgi:transposase